ncbi:MAG: MarR family transcriptional regulator [Thermotaleaceae bacterium]
MRKIEASKQLRELIRMLERKLGILQDSQLECCSITMAQCHALVEIGRAKNISLNELAESLNLENSTMSRTVNNLVTNDFVKRDTDPQDRRYVTISLTEKGLELYTDIEDRMSQFFKNIYSSIQPEKREQVIESIQILLDAVGEEPCCK